MIWSWHRWWWQWSKTHRGKGRHSLRDSRSSLSPHSATLDDGSITWVAVSTIGAWGIWPNCESGIDRNFWFCTLCIPASSSSLRILSSCTALSLSAFSRINCTSPFFSASDWYSLHPRPACNPQLVYELELLGNQCILALPFAFSLNSLKLACSLALIDSWKASSNSDLLLRSALSTWAWTSASTAWCLDSATFSIICVYAGFRSASRAWSFFHTSLIQLKVSSGLVDAATTASRTLIFQFR